MTLNEFQEQAGLTDKYNDQEGLTCCIEGMCEEAGEAVGKLNKWRRKYHNEEFSNEHKEAIAKEIFDELWYSSRAAERLGYSLEQIAEIGFAKLRDRESRGEIDNVNGGDNR